MLPIGELIEKSFLLGCDLIFTIIFYHIFKKISRSICNSAKNMI